MFKVGETVFFIRDNNVCEGRISCVEFPYFFVETENDLIPLLLTSNELYNRKQNALVDCIALTNVSIVLIKENISKLLADKKARLKHKKEMILEYNKLKEEGAE